MCTQSPSAKAGKTIPVRPARSGTGKAIFDDHLEILDFLENKKVVEPKTVLSAVSLARGALVVSCRQRTKNLVTSRLPPRPNPSLSRPRTLLPSAPAKIFDLDPRHPMW